MHLRILDVMTSRDVRDLSDKVLLVLFSVMCVLYLIYVVYNYKYIHISVYKKGGKR